jgi:hypothetical protein
MMNQIRSWGIVAACGSLLAFLGCEKPGAQAPAPEASGEHQHDEAGHEHEHGHATEGPHHGHLIELGEEEYHAELLHDDATHTVTIYLLDSSAKQGVPISAESVTINLVASGKPQQFTLKAAPDSKDPAGQASRFELSDENLIEALEAESAKGRLNVTIGDKSFTGEIEHAAHGDHEHEEAHTH